MKITEVRKKLKFLEGRMSEWGTLDALIKSMDKADKQGLDIAKTYLENAKKRRQEIADKFEDYLK